MHIIYIYHFLQRGSSVSIGIRLWNELPGDRDLISQKGQRYFLLHSVQPGSGNHSSCPMATEDCLPGIDPPGMKLSTHTLTHSTEFKNARGAIPPKPLRPHSMVFNNALENFYGFHNASFMPCQSQTEEGSYSYGAIYKNCIIFVSSCHNSGGQWPVSYYGGLGPIPGQSM